jgi:hypothetical protein
MTTELAKPAELFKLADQFDERQIQNVDGLRDVLCYKMHLGGKDHYELSFKGIKHLVLQMSTKGHPMQVTKRIAEFKGEGKEKTWYATVTVMNKTTQHETDGDSECPFYELDRNGNTLIQDHFARTKALSKAERNAMRKQIPEAMIVNLINEAANNKVKTLTINDFCICEKPQIGVSSGKCVLCGKTVKK